MFISKKFIDELRIYHSSFFLLCLAPFLHPESQEEAKEVVGEYDYYNTKRLHSTIWYIAPKDMLQGKQKAIHQERETKLTIAREQRKEKRQVERVKFLWSLLTLMKFGGNMEVNGNVSG